MATRDRRDVDEMRAGAMRLHTRDRVEGIQGRGDGDRIAALFVCKAGDSPVGDRHHHHPSRAIAGQCDGTRQQAGEFAAEAGSGEAFEDRIFRAYFTEGLNIGKRDVLLELAGQSGLDRAALVEALDSGKYAMRIRNNAMAASQKGIGGVPTFLFGDWPLVGAQSEDVMRRVLQRASEVTSAGQ